MLIEYQSFKELSKITDMPILQGETGNEITCPAEKTVNLDFPVLETSSYSSTLPVIKSGYISIYTLLKKCIFSKSIMKVSTVRKVTMEASIQTSLSHQTGNSHCKLIHTPPRTIALSEATWRQFCFPVNLVIFKAITENARNHLTIISQIQFNTMEKWKKILFIKTLLKVYKTFACPVYLMSSDFNICPLNTERY